MDKIFLPSEVKGKVCLQYEKNNLSSVEDRCKLLKNSHYSSTVWSEQQK
jgi:hypothetical protein